MVARARAAYGCVIGLAILVSNVIAAAPGTSTYVYDNLGRLKSVTYENGKTIVYSYDAAGNRRSSSTAVTVFLNITPAVSVSEGSVATLTVTRSGASDAATVTYQTGDETAVAGTNYNATSGTLNFAVGQASQPITITTKNDSRYDGPLTFSVKLTPVTTNVASTTDTAVVTVNEINAAPQFSIANAAAVSEGSLASFTVTRTNPTSLSQNVQYATADGTGTAGTDYVSVRSAVMFAPSDTTKTVTVATTDVPFYEATRTFTVSLSNPTQGAVLGTATATGTINDGDPATSFAINDPAVVNEGSPVVFTISRSGGPAGIPFSINYATAAGTAVVGTDFAAASGTLSFATSDTSKTVSVTTYNNRTDTTVRTFTMNLSGATNNAPIGDASGAGSIQSVAALSPPTLSPLRQLTATGNWTVSWTSSPGSVARYELWRTDTNVQLYSGLSLTAGGTFGGTDDGLTIPLKVRACSTSTCGAYSNTANVAVCLNMAC